MNRSKRNEYLTKVILMGFFLVALAAFVAWRYAIGQDLDNFHLSVTDLILLGFATLRLGRMIAYDLITEPLRQPFTRTLPDPTGEGDTVEPKGEGARYSVGQLISCPICSGTWVAAVLVLGMYAWPGPARVFITILGAIGAAEVLNSMIEFQSWNGQLARSQSGEIRRRGQAWERERPQAVDAPEEQIPQPIEKR